MPNTPRLLVICTARFHLDKILIKVAVVSRGVADRSGGKSPAPPASRCTLFSSHNKVFQVRQRPVHERPGRPPPIPGACVAVPLSRSTVVPSACLTAHCYCGPVPRILWASAQSICLESTPLFLITTSPVNEANHRPSPPRTSGQAAVVALPRGRRPGFACASSVLACAFHFPRTPSRSFVYVVTGDARLAAGHHLVICCAQPLPTPRLSSSLSPTSISPA